MLYFCLFGKTQAAAVARTSKDTDNEADRPTAATIHKFTEFFLTIIHL